MLGSDLLNSPLEHKLNDACRKLRDYCNRMDRELTTTEIVTASSRTLAAEIATDVYRNNMDASKVAADYGALTSEHHYSADHAMRREAPR